MQNPFGGQIHPLLLVRPGYGGFGSNARLIEDQNFDLDRIP